MSLRLELKYSGGAIRDYVDEKFPNLSLISRQLNQKLKSMKLERDTKFGANDFLYQVTGAAIDYRIRAFLTNDFFRKPAIYGGARVLTDTFGALRTDEEGVFEGIPNTWANSSEDSGAISVAEAMFISLDQTISNISPAKSELSEDAEMRLCKICTLLGSLHMCYHGSWYARKEAWEIGSHDLEEIIEAFDPSVVENVFEVSKLFWQENRDLILNSQIISCGAEFPTSRLLGGAELDFAVDELLFAVECPAYPKVSTDLLRKMVSLWLLDTEDTHRIRSVSIFFPRHNMVWDADFERLVGHTDHGSRDEVRRQFIRTIEEDAAEKIRQRERFLESFRA